MKLAFFVRALLLAPFLLVMVLAAPASAQVIDGASIFGVWKPYIVEIVTGAIAALVGWVINLARQRFNLDIEARHRDALQTTLSNAAGLLINQLDGVAGGIKLDVKNAAIAEAVTYVLKGAPDALKYFGLGPERLREMIVAKAGATIPATT
jgi:hypothetical protein